MSLELQILLPAFLACLVLTGFLAYLGMHVLARGVIFVDIALAQIAALGTAVATLRGIELHTAGSFAWSLGFTFAGALLFALARGLRRAVPAEAFIGITYAVAAAASILVANFTAHGDEEIKEILVGSLLTVSFRDVGITAAIFAVLGAVHFALRRKFLDLSFDHDSPVHDTWQGVLWDLGFYLSFGVVIASSVQMAGVLLVFSFLIVPAVFSALFSRRLGVRLLIAYALGGVVSAAGLWSSFRFDLPTGATVVVTFGAALVLGVIATVLRPGQTAPVSQAPASSRP